MVPEKLGAGNGEGRGEGKRPDKGDSGFVPWLDNDATPVITKCMMYRQNHDRQHFEKDNDYLNSVF